jgi:hypothetical protein
MVKWPADFVRPFKACNRVVETPYIEVNALSMVSAAPKDLSRSGRLGARQKSPP